MQQIYREQPFSAPGSFNRLEYRPLEGFIYAVTPFNFTSIGGNLPSAPAIMGNTVIWKPAQTAVYSNYFIMKLFMEAGLPAGVINFVPGNSSMISEIIFSERDFAGVHFTGSTEVFNGMYRKIGENIDKYRTYPRIVGETGGKDFIFVHESADVDSVTTALVRGAFEYQGQKCSAASRAYIPQSLWEKIKIKLIQQVRDISTGSPEDFRNFVNAVIDKNSFDKIKEYIEYCKSNSDAEIITGGKYDDSVGYFIEPTTVLVKDPFFKTMQEEIFGPLLTIYVYPDEKYEETLEICDRTSLYGLTGSIFAKDRLAVLKAHSILKNSAGNFYINDKPTGAVVGQQPFGGARGSGTNDKAGSYLNLLRWTSPRTVKETYISPNDFKYPFMRDEF
jgi:1-pyrroline-5-carboxylate dehydrogenase